MAHQLKYYKEIASHGHDWRLEIHQDTEEALTPMEIGPVLQSLRLVVQGEQADIDTPIVKTSLEMSFIDAPDFDEERKCGYWEEFYTSSATEYKVILLKDGQTEWTGYITPDSFAEDLRYRGSVSIIARDNLGTLQDTTCDVADLQNLDGKVYISDLIEKAMAVSTCAMEYDLDENAFPYGDPGLYLISGHATMQMVDIKKLHEMNWWQALEAVLYSIGGVMRYVGGNRFSIVPMRDLPKCGHAEWWDVPVRDVHFLTYGHRELVPGAKEITETHEFAIDTEEEAEKIVGYEGRATRTCFDLKFTAPDGTVTGPTINVPTSGYTNSKTHEDTTAASSNLLNVSAYPLLKGEDSEAYGAWDDNSIVYYAANTYNRTAGATEEYPLRFRRRIYMSTEGAKVDISFTLAKPVTLTADYSHVLNFPLDFVEISSIMPPLVYYRIKHTSESNAVQYYDANAKKWGSSDVEQYITATKAAELIVRDNPGEYPLEIKGIEVPSAGYIDFEIRRITIDVSTYAFLPHLRYACAGLFFRLKGIRIDMAVSEDVHFVEKITINTKYSDKYSVRLSRDPELAVCPSQQQEVMYVRNALLKEVNNGYEGADKWVWLNGASMDQAGIASLPDTGISLTRLIHQQMLTYYAQPNNVLTGELFLEDGMPDFASLWRWNNADHILLSGTLNILTGRMEGATLRQFVRYDHMWETWVEEENIILDYGSGLFGIHSHKEGGVTEDDIKGLPSWVTLQKISPVQGNKNTLIMRLMENATGQTRQAQFKVDTAVVRITQMAAGDFGMDYSSDFS